MVVGTAVVVLGACGVVVTKLWLRLVVMCGTAVLVVGVTQLVVA